MPLLLLQTCLIRSRRSRAWGKERRPYATTSRFDSTNGIRWRRGTYPTCRRRQRWSLLCSPTTTVWEPVTAKRKPRTDRKWALGSTVLRITPSPLSRPGRVSGMNSCREWPMWTQYPQWSSLEPTWLEQLPVSSRRSYMTALRNSMWTLMHRSTHDMQNGPSRTRPTPYSEELLSMHWMQKKQLAPRRSRNGQPRTTPGWKVERINRWRDTHGVSHRNHSNRPLRNQPRASSSTGVSLAQSLWTNARGSAVIDMAGSTCRVSLTLYSRKCKFSYSNPSGRIAGINKLTTWARI